MLPWADIGPTSARRRLLEYDELGDNFDRSGDNAAVDMGAYSQEDGRDAGEDFLDEFRPSRFGPGLAPHRRATSTPRARRRLPDLSTLRGPYRPQGVPGELAL